MTTDNKVSQDTNKKVTLKDRKKAQPNAVLYFSDDEKKAIKEIVAKNLTDEQTKIFFYTCQALGLNPLVSEICAVTYKTKNEDGSYSSKMSIQVMRDGFLTIAHRSGKFAGLESGVREEVVGGKECLVGWAKVYHKDFTVPVYQEADFNEYNASDRNPLWRTKPRTMIKKVAESMALRKAFNVNGVYAPEEMEKEIGSTTVAVKTLELENGNAPITPEQIKTIQAMDQDLLVIDGETKEDRLSNLKSMTKQQGAETIQELATRK